MMKTILLLAVLIPLQVFAGLPPTTLKGQGGSNVTTFGFQVPLNQATQVSGVNSLIETGNTNILANPGFEGTTGWTASGGATTAINSTAAGTGSQGYDWDSNGASQTLTGDAVTIPAGLKGRNGVVSCNIKTPSGTATHTLGVYDGSTLLASATINSSSSFVRTTTNFVFPSSGTLTARLTSVNANEPEIYIDDCFLGLADGFNVGYVAQATVYGTWRMTGVTNCNFATTTTFGNLSADSDCNSPTATGNLSTSAGKIPGVASAAAVSPGDYLVRAYFAAASSGAATCSYRLSDGTTNGNSQQSTASGPVQTMILEQLFSYTTAQSSVTWQIQVDRSGGTNCQVDAQAANKDIYITVTKLPSTSETAFRPELNATYYSGYHGSGCAAWTRTNTSYGAITDDAAGCTLTDLQKSGITAATTGSVSPAIAVTLPRTGTYKVCAYPVAGGSGSAVHQYRLWDGTTTIAEGSLDIASDATIPLCGFYSATSLTPTFTVQCKASSGTCTINAGASDVGILWTINPVTGNVPAPVLVGSVTNNSTGAMRVEAVSVAAPSAGACAVTESGSSDWINGNATSSGTGLCAFTINTGIFSSRPVCTCTVENNTNRECVFSATPTTTSLATRTESTSTATNDAFDIICVGPR